MCDLDRGMEGVVVIIAYRIADPVMRAVPLTTRTDTIRFCTHVFPLHSRLGIPVLRA
jgi:hypothetical protein